MRKFLKNLLLPAIILSSMSFSLFYTPTIELTNINASLDNNKFDLKDKTYLLNKSKFESLYVEISSSKIYGKQYNKVTEKKEKIVGTKYTLNFYEKCNIKDVKLKNNKTYITVWDNGRIDSWNTEKGIEVDEYNLKISVIK